MSRFILNTEKFANQMENIVEGVIQKCKVRSVDKVRCTILLVKELFARNLLENEMMKPLYLTQLESKEDFKRLNCHTFAEDRFEAPKP